MIVPIVSCEQEIGYQFRCADREAILNLVNSNQICVIITLFQLIWHQTEFRSEQNQSKNCNYNPNVLDLTGFRTDKSVCVEGKQAGNIYQGVMPNKLSH